MNWAREFYTKQNQWSGVYENGPLPPRRQARWRGGLGAAPVDRQTRTAWLTWQFSL